MSERQGAERSDATDGTRSDDVEQVTAASGGAAIDPFAGREGSPEVAAALLRRRADQRSGILTRLHQTRGAAFVRQVLSALETSEEEPESQPDSATPVSMSSLAEWSGPVAATTAPESTSPPTPEAAASSATASSSWTFPAVVRVTATDGLWVRRTPDATRRSNVVGGLSPGEEIEALAQEGEWLRVSHRDQIAFIHAGFVELAPAGEEADPGATAQPRAEVPQVAQTAPAHAAPGASAEAAPVQVASTTSGVSTPTSGPAPSREPTAEEFRTLSGNVIAKTTAQEAAVLNALRADHRRLDPAWLVTAQRVLGVADATGAMNTETLRAMRTRSGNRSLGAAAILATPFLATIAPGDPFASNEDGFEDHATDPRARGAADRAAQAVGYSSYREYRSSWTSVRFLGKPLRGGGSGEGHPYLAERLGVAEAFLRQRHPGENDEAVRRAIGWNGGGNAAYDDDLDTRFSHQHTMGLAIDIDPSQNPYIFNEHIGGLTHEQSMWWIGVFEEMFRIATRLYGGEPIAPATLLEWSRTSSTEELFQRVQATSEAFARLLALSNRPEPEILSALTSAGYARPEAEATVPAVQRAEGYFHGGGGRQRARSLTNIQQELLIALRDVAGLSWGGTEMSARENGDFMHFDCRDTEFGRAVYSRTRPRNR
jgi:hypothetical protein